MIDRVAPEGRRRTAMFLGNPLLWVVVVNGGHNDVLVGAAILIAFAVATRGHPVAGGVAAAAASATKLPALAPAAGIALVLWARRGGRAALAFTATTAVLLVPASIAWPQWPGAALHATGGLTTRATTWTWWHAAFRTPGTTITRFALALVAVVAGVVLVWTARRARRGITDPAALVAALAAVYTVAAAYVLPWYVMWALPVAALAADPRIYRWALVQAAWLTACYQLGDRDDTTSALARVLLFAGPIVVLGAFLFVVCTDGGATKKTAGTFRHPPSRRLLPT